MILEVWMPHHRILSGCGLKNLFRLFFAQNDFAVADGLIVHP